MKILVMGGTRFFGKLLVKNLLRGKHDVSILTRGLTRDDFGTRVKRLVCERSDATQMQKTLRGKKFDVVYDQVCFSPYEAQIAVEIFSKDVRYILTSSMYVYHENKRKLREEDFNPGVCKIPKGRKKKFSYEEGKRLAEAFFFQEAPFSVVAVRFPIVMGHDDYTGRFHFHLEKILRDKAICIPYPNGKMNYICASEAASFLSWLKDASVNGPINAASPEGLTAEDLVKEFGRVLKRKPNIIRDKKLSKGIVSPYYRRGNMVMDIGRAQSFGYRFSSFFDWFEKEVLLGAQGIKGC